MKSIFTLLLTLAVFQLYGQASGKIIEEQIDTIITFDPETYEETIQIVRTTVREDDTKKIIHSSSPILSPNDSRADKMVSDTIITFDPITKKETIRIITRIEQN